MIMKTNNKRLKKNKSLGNSKYPAKEEKCYLENHKHLMRM